MTSVDSLPRVVCFAFFSCKGNTLDELTKVEGDLIALKILTDGT